MSKLLGEMHDFSSYKEMLETVFTTDLSSLGAESKGSRILKVKKSRRFSYKK